MSFKEIWQSLLKFDPALFNFSYKCAHIYAQGHSLKHYLKRQNTENHLKVYGLQPTYTNEQKGWNGSVCSVMDWSLGVWISWCCSNKLPCMLWLKTALSCYRSGGQKSKINVTGLKPGCWQCRLLLRGLGKNPFLCLFQHPELTGTPHLWAPFSICKANSTAPSTLTLTSASIILSVLCLPFMRAHLGNPG